MTKFRIKSTKLLVLTIGLLLIVSLALILFENSVATSAFASESEVSAFEAKRYSNAKIEEDFDDSSIIVVMDRTQGGINKIHADSFFGNFARTAINDLTFVDGDISSKRYLDVDNFRQILEIKLPENSKENVLSVIRELEKIDGVYYAGPNYLGQAGAVPRNSQYNLQWGVDGTSGTVGINAQAAWDITTGSRDVRVAVIDTGIVAHQNLNANLVAGWNFVNGTNDATDTDGHGTHIAGIIGGVEGNIAGSTNIVGVNWNVSLIPLKISNTVTGWQTSRVVSAITWARNQNVPIINFSGWNFGSADLSSAIGAYTGLFVCIAGNGNGTNINPGQSPNYPGSHTFAHQITVGSLDSNGTIRSTSNVGSTAVHLFAPGGSIWSTIPGNTYGYMSGTSMAAPHVAGVAALLLSVNPTLTPAQMKAAILDNVDTSSALSSNCSTGGRLNAVRAVNAALFDVSTSGVLTVRSGAILPGTLVIPANLHGRTVTQIASYAFANQTSLTSIALPDTLTTIGNNAFQNCTNLTSINIPAGITQIGTGAFSGCVNLHIIGRFNINANVNTRWDLSQATFNSVSNGVLTTNCEATAHHGAGQVVSVIPGATYTVSFNLLSLGAGSAAWVVVYQDLGNSPLQSPHRFTALTAHSFTFTAANNRALIAFSSEAGLGAQFSNIQITRTL